MMAMRLVLTFTIAVLCGGPALAAAAAADINSNRAQDVSPNRLRPNSIADSSSTTADRRLNDYVLKNGRLLQATRPPLSTATRPPIPSPGSGVQTRPPFVPGGGSSDGTETPAGVQTGPPFVPGGGSSDGTETPTFSPTISPTGIVVGVVTTDSPVVMKEETAVPTFSPTISPVVVTRPPIQTRPPIGDGTGTRPPFGGEAGTTPPTVIIPTGGNPTPTTQGGSPGDGGTRPPFGGEGGTSPPIGGTPAPGPPLTTAGNNGEPTEAFPLGVCEGECDDDEDCAEGLQCFKRSGIEPVPGCSGEGESGDDYCYLPLFNLTTAGNNGVPAEAFPLGQCEGDCDDDNECAEGLKCFKRNANQTVPGCGGLGVEGEDYCYADPELAPTTPAPVASGNPPVTPFPTISGASNTDEPSSFPSAMKSEATPAPVASGNPPVTPFPTISGTSKSPTLPPAAGMTLDPAPEPTPAPSPGPTPAPSPGPTPGPTPAPGPEPTPAPTPEPSSMVSVMPPTTEPPTTMVSVLPGSTEAPTVVLPPSTEPPTGMVSMLPPPTTIVPTTPQTSSPTRNITNPIFAKSSKLYKPPPGTKAEKAAKSSKGAKSTKALSLETISRPSSKSSKSAKVSGKSGKSTDGKSGKGSKKGYLLGLERMADHSRSAAQGLCYRQGIWGIVFVASMIMLWR